MIRDKIFFLASNSFIAPPLPFSQVFLCMNWAVSADILFYVVIPTRRSTAEAFQILVSHLFGDAGSPTLIGLISDSIRNEVSF